MINDREGVVVLEIDTAGLPKDVRFYVDQEFGIPRDGRPRSVFTTSVIPPEAIYVHRG